MSMTYEEMMGIGEACGLTTVGECYDFVERHYDTFFDIDKVNEELHKLQLDIRGKNPEAFNESFEVRA